MNGVPYSRLLNFAWYQLLWFTAILGGAAFEPVLLVLLLVFVVISTLRTVSALPPERR